MKSSNFCALLLIFSFVLLNVKVWCSEITYSINVQNLANSVSENFISYELNTFDIAEFSRNARVLKNLSNFSPCYIKLHGGVFNEREVAKFEMNKISISDMMKVFRYELCC